MTNVGGVPRTEAGRRGKIVVLAILGLGVGAAITKIAQETRVGPEVEARIRSLERELGGLDPERFLGEDLRRLEEFLRSGGHYSYFIEYRDRAIPLLEEMARREPSLQGLGRPPSLPRAASLLILLRINSPRSRHFFEEELLSIEEPHLRREVESYTARHK